MEEWNDNSIENFSEHAFTLPEVVYNPTLCGNDESSFIVLAMFFL